MGRKRARQATGANRPKAVPPQRLVAMLKTTDSTPPLITYPPCPTSEEPGSVLIFSAVQSRLLFIFAIWRMRVVLPDRPISTISKAHRKDSVIAAG